MKSADDLQPDVIEEVTSPDFAEVNIFGMERSDTAKLPIPTAVTDLVERVYAIAQDRIRMRQAEKLIEGLVKHRKETSPKREEDSVLQDRKKLEAQQGEPLYQKFAFQRWIKHLPEHFRLRFFAVALYLKPVCDRIQQQLDPENEEPIVTPILIDYLLRQVKHIHQLVSTYMPEDKSEAKVNLPVSIIELIKYVKYLDIRTKEAGFQYDEEEVKTKLAEFRKEFQQNLESIENLTIRNNAEEVLYSLEDPNQDSDATYLIEAYKLALSQLPDWNLIPPKDINIDMLRIAGRTTSSLKRWDTILQTLQQVGDNKDFLVTNVRALANEIQVFTENYELLLDSFANQALSQVSHNVPEEARTKIMKMIKEAIGIITLLSCVKPNENGEYSKAVITTLREALDKFNNLRELIKKEYKELEEKQSAKETPAEDDIDGMLNSLDSEGEFTAQYLDLLSLYSFTMFHEANQAQGMIDVAQQKGTNGDLGPQAQTAINSLQEILERLVIASVKATNETVGSYDIFPRLEAKVEALKEFRQKVNNFILDMNSKLHLFGKAFDNLNKGEEVNLARVLGMFQNILDLMDRNECLGKLFADKPEINWECTRSELEKFLEKENQSRREITDMAEIVSNFQNGISAVPKDLSLNPDLIDHDKENILKAKQGVYSARVLIESLNSFLVGDPDEEKENDEDEEKTLDPIQEEFMISANSKVSDVLARAKVALLQCLDRDTEIVTEVMMIVDWVETSEDLNKKIVHLNALETNLEALPTILSI
ncbi:hypothetical protein ACFL3T_00775 [Patescibacteria group bacterium]